MTVNITAVEEEKDEDGEVVTSARKGEEFEISPNDEEELVAQLYKDLPVNTSAISSLTKTLSSGYRLQKGGG